MLLTHSAAIRDEGNYGSRGMQPGCTLRELLSAPENWLSAVRAKPSITATSAQASRASSWNAPPACRLTTSCVSACLSRFPSAPAMIHGAFPPVSDLSNGYGVRFFLPRLKYDAAKLAARPAEPFEPERDYLCAAGRLITDSDGMAKLLGLLASHGEISVLSRSSLDLMRMPQDGLGGIGSIGRGLNVAYLPNVFPGVSPVGHQGVAYGMSPSFRRP